jgi:hypothetical protein
MMNGGRAVRPPTPSPSLRNTDEMIGFYVCLHRDMALDDGDYCFYGRNGIHVSLRCSIYMMKSTQKLMLSQGANCWWSISLVPSPLRFSQCHYSLSTGFLSSRRLVSRMY